MEGFNTRKKETLSPFSQIALPSHMINDRILLLVFTEITSHGAFSWTLQTGVAITSEMNKYFENEVLTQGTTY